MSAFNTYFNLRQSMNKPKEMKKLQADAMSPDAINASLNSYRALAPTLGNNVVPQEASPSVPAGAAQAYQDRRAMAPTPQPQANIQPVAFSAPVQQPRTVPSGPGTHDVPMVESQAGPQTAKFDAAAHFEARDALSRDLRAAREARVGAAQRGEDFSVFKAAEDELTRRLGMMNKIRNLEAAGQITPEQRLANAEALDAQVGPARLAAAESLGNEAAARMAAAGRFPQAQGRADEAVRAFADATGRINAPGPDFAGQVPDQNGRDFAGETLSARQRLQGMVSSPDVAALEANGFKTESQVNQERLQRAMEMRQIAEQEQGVANSDDEFYAAIAGLPAGTRIPDEFRNQVREFAARRFGREIDSGIREDEIAAARSNPTTAFITNSGVDAVGRFMANQDDAGAISDLEDVMQRIDAIQDPEMRSGAKAAIAEAMMGGGVSLSDFREPPSGVLEGKGDSATMLGLLNPATTTIAVNAQLADPNSFTRRLVDWLMGRPSASDRARRAMDLRRSLSDLSSQ